MSAPQHKINTETLQRNIVLKWRASGLSQAEFCRKEGIPEWSLSQWKRREDRNSDSVAAQAKETAAAERKAKRLKAKRRHFIAAPIARKSWHRFWYHRPRSESNFGMHKLQQMCIHGFHSLSEILYAKNDVAGRYIIVG